MSNLSTDLSVIEMLENAEVEYDTSCITFICPGSMNIIDLKARIKHEITTAVNIKSNNNRKSVIQNLKRVDAYVSAMRAMPKNGIAIFAGSFIDAKCDNLHIIQPPRAIRSFIYRCDPKHFQIESIKQLYITPKENYGIIKIFGEKTTIQIVNEFAEITTLDVKTTVLQRNQSHGGQSKNRIERLRQESIHNYLALAAEKAIRAFVKDGVPIIKSLLIVGPGMKKSQIIEYINESALMNTPITVRAVEKEDVSLSPTYFRLNCIK
jgi:peptide subunit release factor 1 (eRF1)